MGNYLWIGVILVSSVETCIKLFNMFIHELEVNKSLLIEMCVCVTQSDE